MVLVRYCLVLATLFTSVSVIASDPVLRFATEASYPPFEVLDAEQQFQGFDIELARSLCV